MKCLVCGVETKAELCGNHRKAKDALEAAYPRWTRAYGEMDWRAFLDNVKRNPRTGQWARETAGFLEGI